MSDVTFQLPNVLLLLSIVVFFSAGQLHISGNNSFYTSSSTLANTLLEKLSVCNGRISIPQHLATSCESEDIHLVKGNVN